MAIFNSYVSHYQRVFPKKQHYSTLYTFLRYDWVKKHLPEMHIYQVGFAETSRLQADGWMKHNTLTWKMYVEKKIMTSLRPHWCLVGETIPMWPYFRLVNCYNVSKYEYNSNNNKNNNYIYIICIVELQSNELFVMHNNCDRQRWFRLGLGLTGAFQDSASNRKRGLARLQTTRCQATLWLHGSQ